MSTVTDYKMYLSPAWRGVLVSAGTSVMWVSKLGRVSTW